MHVQYMCMYAFHTCAKVNIKSRWIKKTEVARESLENADQKEREQASEIRREGVRSSVIVSDERLGEKETQGSLLQGRLNQVQQTAGEAGNSHAQLKPMQMAYNWDGTCYKLWTKISGNKVYLHVCMKSACLQTHYLQPGSTSSLAIAGGVTIEATEFCITQHRGNM